MQYHTRKNYTGYDERQNQRAKFKLIDNVSFGFLIISVALLKFAGENYIGNIITANNFLLEWIAVGLVLGGAWLYILYKTLPNYFTGKEKRAGAVLSQFFAVVVITVFLAAYANIETGKETYKKTAAVIKKSKSTLYGNLFIHLNLDGRVERFSPSKKEFKNISVGDTILLTVGKGCFGYESIYKFGSDSTK